MNISVLTDVRPNLFLRRCVLHSLDDLFRIGADDGTHANSAAFTVANVGEIFTLEHPGVPQHIQPTFTVRIVRFLLQLLKLRDLRLDLGSGDKIFPAQIDKLAPAQTGSFAELDQFIVV